ncbi:MAG TPA: hypothetical protein VGC97_05595 [Pyrinomonadaceae bacterium]
MKIQLLFLFIFVGLFFPCAAVAGDGMIEPPIWCKKAEANFDRKIIEADIEKFRKGETSTIESRPELIRCLEAVPILKKYIIDPDPNVRYLITDLLGYHILPQRLPLFLSQLEAFPLKNNGIQYAYKYPCKQFKKIKSKRLVDSLISRIKSTPGSVYDQEIYLLGCLAGRDFAAEEFLISMKQPSFQHNLTKEARESQLMTINYALAEAGYPDAEKITIAEIERITNDERATLQFLLGTMRGFTNCRILLPASRWILDERNVPSDFLKENEKKMQIGDIAAGVFEVVLNGEIGGESANRKPFAIEERRKIFRRVQMNLNKVPNCRS